MTQAGYFSQFGEDRILAKTFAGKLHGVCVEVGANNGVDGSTTLHFEEQGWDCVLIEPIPELCRKLRAQRRAKVFECAASSAAGTATLHVGTGAPLAHAVSALGDSAEIIRNLHGHDSRPIEVQTRPLDDILAEANVGDIDFMTIDVEGHEIELLKGFTPTRWRPSILIIEDNTWGGSAVCRELRQSGYHRFRRTGVNDWYAHENHPMADLGGRLRYYPSLLAARAYMFFETQIAPTLLPILRRIPGVIALRDMLHG